MPLWTSEGTSKSPSLQLSHREIFKMIFKLLQPVKSGYEIESSERCWTLMAKLINLSLSNSISIKIFEKKLFEFNNNCRTIFWLAGLLIEILTIQFVSWVVSIACISECGTPSWACSLNNQTKFAITHLGVLLLPS